MNILFTPPADDRILDGIKTMTARCWRQNPPRLSEVICAQTGRRKDTAFAYLKVVGLALWRPDTDTSRDLEERTGYSLGEIAEREGFRTWEEFVDTYKALNAHNWDDPKRKHFFIDFEVVENLREML